jgi:nucleoside-diphosphate-sugar epimerase
MNIFLAGATGVIGRQLVPRLAHAGHQVTALTRSRKGAELIRGLGGRAIIGDVFNRERLIDAVIATKPDVLIHQLTSLPEAIDPRKIQSELAATNRVRTEGTRNLIDAATAAGVRRIVAQSFSPYYTPSHNPVATEVEELFIDPPSSLAETVQALKDLESAVLNTSGIEGMVLRYGYFYGEGTAYATDGSITDMVVNRKFPIVGDGSGTFSFIYIDDAADATILAVNSQKTGIFNITDNDPAPISEWLPYYAELLNAPQPMRLPKFIGRIAAGRAAIFMMTEQRGASNDKAKRELGWQPTYSSWRQGFREVLRRKVHSNVA